MKLSRKLGIIFLLKLSSILALSFILFAKLFRVDFLNNLKNNSLLNKAFGISRVIADVPRGGGGGGGGGDSGGGDPGGANSDNGGGGCGNGGDADCFKPGTLVATNFNPSTKTFSSKKIEELQIGDVIVGSVFDESGNLILQEAKVYKLLHHEPKEHRFLKLITKKGAEVIATDNHRIIVDIQNGGEKMNNLQKGQQMVSAFSAPDWDEVESADLISTETTPSFNIETKTHNYLVSQNGKNWILVHNWK